MIERKEHIKQTILWLENRKQQLSDEIIEVELCVETLMQLMGYKREEAETKKTNPQNQKMIPGEIKKPKRPYKRREVKPKQSKASEPKPVPKKPARSNTKTTSAGDLRKGKKSKYKGVSPTKPKKNGDFRWRSFYWDGKNNKCVTVGAYDTELMAAAAYQDYTGNKAEADKLRAQAKQQQADMVEQAENNQDRPPAKKRKKTKMIYVCKRCGLEWKSKPKECPHCGNDDFREVQK